MARNIFQIARAFSAARNSFRIACAFIKYSQAAARGAGCYIFVAMLPDPATSIQATPMQQLS